MRKDNIKETFTKRSKKIMSNNMEKLITTLYVCKKDNTYTAQEFSYNVFKRED